MTKYWDGNESLPFIQDDGGRLAAGFKGSPGDCVTRAVTIVSGKPYAEVYAALSAGSRSERITRGRARKASAHNGVHTTRKWFRNYMASLGFVWTPTMRVGEGCKVHLLAGELPMGRLVVAVSRHYTAVIDGVIHDTFDPSRATLHSDSQGRSGGGFGRMSHRCVYGYWKAA